jgi:hypothetical protein
VAVLILPSLGAWLAGYPLSAFFQFPLISRGWDPLPFDPRAYAVACAGALIMLLAFAGLALSGRQRTQPTPASPPSAYPRWIGLGLASLALGVFVAALRQPLASAPWLWLGLILLINGSTWRRTGQCLLTRRPGYLLSLFPAGMLTGWLIHYLNLFLRSWYYPGLDQTPGWQIAFVHSLEFGLLLPLLISLRHWLAGHPRLLHRLLHGRPFYGGQGVDRGWLLLALGAIGLAGAGIWPDRLVSLSWMAPLLVAIGLSLTLGRPTPFAGLRHGDWSRPVLGAVAALLIGLLDLAWDQAWGPVRRFSVSLLQGPDLLGLPIPALAQFVVWGLLGLWVADQLVTPWRRRPLQRFPKFPVRVVLK